MKIKQINIKSKREKVVKLELSQQHQLDKDVQSVKD